MYLICPRCRLPGLDVADRCPACAAELAGLPGRDGASLAGAVIEGRYELMELVGEGSMSWVYRGLHPEVGASVAIKLLKPAFAEDPGQLARFRKEAAAISSLSHPHILTVISSGETSSKLHYMVTEFIQGRTLARLAEEEGPLPLSRAVDILRQILFALEEAHRQGIVHRDLKPENVMVIPLRSGEDFCKIVDFGIALRRIPDERRLTKAGQIIGTPAYMSPEVIRGEDAGPQSDLFCAGVILYELVCGELPWRSGSLFETLLAHLNEEPVPLRRRNPALPARLERLIATALVKEPQDRIPSASEFLRQLQLGASPTIQVCATCLSPVLLEEKFCPNCGRLQEGRSSDVGDVADALLVPVADAADALLVPVADAATDLRMFQVPFFGRADERARIQAFLAGSDTCLELTGEEGVGKAALVQVALADGTIPGTRVLRLEHDPRQGRRAWWPLRRLVQVLGGVPAEPGAQALRALCVRLGLDTEDEPHVLHLFGVFDVSLALENRVRLREMVISVARLVQAFAAAHPTILVATDAHRFDGPTRAVLDRLVTQGGPGSLRLVVTGTGPVIPGGEHRPFVSRLRVERLGAGAARRFCEEALRGAGTDGQEALGRLVEAAAGLPLHLLHGLRLLHEGIRDVERTLPDLVQLRVRNLPVGAHRLLQWTAVAGGSLPGAFAQEAGLLEKGGTDVFLTCVRHGFLAGEAGDFLTLTHPALARLILAEMPVQVRADMHHRLFDWLRSHESDPRVLAEHALQARQVELAASYFERAGAFGEDQLDDLGAVQSYRRAFELTEFGARQGRDLQRFQEICLRYGDLLRYTDQLPEAERVLQEGLLYGREEDPATAQLLASLARCVCLGAPEHAERLVQRAMRAATRLSNPQMLYRVFFEIAQVFLQARRFEQGLAAIRTGLSLLEGLPGAPDTLWRLHVQCAQCEAGAGRLEQAAQTCVAALEREDVGASWIAQARLQEELARIHLEARDARRAAERLQLALAALRFAGDRTAMVDDELRLAALDRENRRAWAESALAHARRIGYANGMARALELMN